MPDTHRGGDRSMERLTTLGARLPVALVLALLAMVVIVPSEAVSRDVRRLEQPRPRRDRHDPAVERNGRNVHKRRNDPLRGRRLHRRRRVAQGRPHRDVERVQLGCARRRSRRHGQRRLRDRGRPDDRQGVRGWLVPERRWRHPGGSHRGVQRDDVDIAVPHRAQRAGLRARDRRSNVVRGRWLRQRRRCDGGGRHRRLQHRHRGMVRDHRCIR